MIPMAKIEAVTHSDGTKNKHPKTGGPSQSEPGILNGPHLREGFAVLLPPWYRASRASGRTHTDLPRQLQLVKATHQNN